MEKAEALKIIMECATYYKENYENNKLLLICANNSLKNISTIECAFGKTNFLHLTGVKFSVNKRLSPIDFYTAALSKRLSPNHFEFSHDGTTELKLRVLPMILRSQSLAANMTGDYNLRKPYLVTDKLAGGIKCCIGFKYDSSLKCYVPNTVLNEDIRINICNQQRVILVYRKRMSDFRYTKMVYSAKKINWQGICLPVEYQYLPLPFRT